MKRQAEGAIPHVFSPRCRARNGFGQFRTSGRVVGVGDLGNDTQLAFRSVHKLATGRARPIGWLEALATQGFTKD